MKALRLLTMAAGLMMCLAPALSTAQGDIQAGRSKAYTCLGCHGVDGYRNAYPSFRVPKLGGQHAAYIVSALKAYKAGDREHTTMQALAGTLSEQDMQDIAAYFEAAGRGGQ